MNLRVFETDHWKLWTMPRALAVQILSQTAKQSPRISSGGKRPPKFRNNLRRNVSERTKKIFTPALGEAQHHESWFSSKRTPSGQRCANALLKVRWPQARTIKRSAHSSRRAVMKAIGALPIDHLRIAEHRRRFKLSPFALCWTLRSFMQSPAAG